MDSIDRRRSSGFDRRRSSRNSTRHSMQQNENDDEYDLEALGIADGFRPGIGSDGPSGAAARQRMSTQMSRSEQTSRISTAPPPRPSSITKPRYDSFALRHDGATNPLAPIGLAGMASSSATGLLSRTSSVSTTEDPFVRSESPYQGPSAPSHPYQMYPQDAARIARTASVATTSTYQPPSIPLDYTGPGGPTHPYGMYPQNTVPEVEDNGVSPAAVIPVGFPGRNNDYQRRLGPEGEEAADLIGPDGHTEQLPPYTQYDEARARKGAAVAPPLITTAGGGIGRATRNPEFASSEDLANPFESPVDRTPTSSSDHRISPTVTGGVSEKPPEKKWKRIAKRKVCGIVPVWVFVMLAAAIVIFAIIVGVAVAMVKARMKGDRPPPPPPPPSTTVTSGIQYATTVTTTYDATPLATVPANLPAIQTGTFWLNINNAQTASPNCIPDTSLLNAWGCNIPSNMLHMTVNNIPGGDSTSNYLISISQNSTTYNGAPNYFYGTQPPSISSDQVMDLVNDTNSNRYGPAWFFQIPYDKLVIVPETLLSMPSASSTTTSKEKRETLQQRHDSGSRAGSFSYDPIRRGIPAGDRPWFCYWNHTLLETFIYPNASTVATSATTSSTATSYKSAATSTSSSSSDFLKNLIPQYPKIVRVEERRISHSRGQPYCIQMQILDSGWANIYPNPTTGQNNTIILNESLSSNIQSRSSARGYQLYDRKESDESSCSCVWLAT